MGRDCLIEVIRMEHELNAVRIGLCVEYHTGQAIARNTSATLQRLAMRAMVAELSIGTTCTHQSMLRSSSTDIAPSSNFKCAIIVFFRGARWGEVLSLSSSEPASVHDTDTSNGHSDSFSTHVTVTARGRENSNRKTGKCQLPSAIAAKVLRKCVS